MTASSPTTQVNLEAWRTGSFVAEYANRRLLPVEVLLLARYREPLSERVLEVGCGAGRILGYLDALGGEVHGIDISLAMVEHCRAAFPKVHVSIGDMAALPDAAEGHFTAVLAMDNVIDVFDDAERRAVLTAIRKLVAPDGLLIFSSHNLAYLDRPVPAGPRRRRRAGELLWKAASRPIAEMGPILARLPRRIANRRRMARLEHRAPDYALINDTAHDYRLLHYYIRSEDQARQLADVGYELVECLDVDGRPLGPGGVSTDPWLHYVARPAPGFEELVS